MNPSPLVELQGRCVDGYTEDDVVSVSGRIFEATGYRFAVIWEYFDEMGGGGCSTEYLVQGEENFFELPAQLAALLFEDTPLDEDALRAELAVLTPAAADETSGLTECDSWGCNYTQDFRLGETDED